jgi:hypothetical protein
VGKKRGGLVSLMNGILIQWIVVLDRSDGSSKFPLGFFFIVSPFVVWV